MVTIWVYHDDEEQDDHDDNESDGSSSISGNSVETIVIANSCDYFNLVTTFFFLDVSTYLPLEVVKTSE